MAEILIPGVDEETVAILTARATRIGVDLEDYVRQIIEEVYAQLRNSER